jgi:hypothetical protein
MLIRRRHFRIWPVALVMVACVAWTLWLFDWRAVARSMAHMHVGVFLAGALPILLCVFAARGWRWLVVLGLSPNISRFWQSLCANGAAAGLASMTPFQIGEVVKLRTIPDHHGSAWRLGVSAFFVERALDLAGMLGSGLGGLAIHFKFEWLAPVALSMPLLAGLSLCLLAGWTRLLPHRLQPYAEVLHHWRRIIGASMLTMVIWLLYTALWWVAARSIGVYLEFNQVSILLGGVMLTVVVSMVPGGFGIAELGSRGLMLWLGASRVDADATAIALRLLTPLLALSGGICLLLLLRFRHAPVPPIAEDTEQG